MKKLSIIIILLSILCAGCTIDCPEFPVELDYFPYYTGQVLEFTNSKYDLQTYTITYKIFSDPSSCSTGLYSKCECSAYTEFQAGRNRDKANIDMFFTFRGLRRVGEINIQGRFLDTFIEKSILTKKGGVSFKNVHKYLDNTISIESTRENCSIKKVVIVKNKGIVSYTTADGEEWKLVE
jgi:hypothetical protein